MEEETVSERTVTTRMWMPSVDLDPAQEEVMVMETVVLVLVVAQRAVVIRGAVVHVVVEVVEVDAGAVEDAEDAVALVGHRLLGSRMRRQLEHLSISQRSTFSLDDYISVGKSKKGKGKKAVLTPIPAVSAKIEPAETKFAPKLPRANRDNMEEAKLLTNQYLLELDPEQEIFRFDVEVSLLIGSAGKKGAGTKQTISLIEGDKDDSAVQRRHELVREALRAALIKYDLLSSNGALVYDEAAILFVNEDISVGLRMYHGMLSVNVKELGKSVKDLIATEDAECVEFRIVPCRDGASEFTLGELLEDVQMGKITDQPLRQFLELLTDQDVRNQSKFVVYGAGRGFKLGLGEDIGNAMERREGYQKGVRCLEGTPELRDKGNGIVTALCVDSKSGTFFRSQKLLNAIEQVSGKPGYRLSVVDFKKDCAASKFVKGLRLEYLDGLAVSFIASGFSKEMLRDCRETLPALRNREGLTTSKFPDVVFEYPELPAVMEKRKDGTVLYHPIELLKIAEGQRVPVRKQPDVKEADEPEIKWQQICNIMDELRPKVGKGDDKPLLEKFGVRISPKHMQVTGFRRRAPELIYGGGQKAAIDDDASWTTSKIPFKYAAAVGKLFVAYGNECDRPLAEDFLNKLVVHASKKGMELREHRLVKVDLEREVLQKETVLKQIADDSENDDHAPIVVYVDQKHIKSHGMLKFLEVVLQLTTQHITTQTLQKIRKGDTSIMENVLMKLNMKVGGLNYEVVPEAYARLDWLTDRTMVMGYDLAHPTDKSAAVVTAAGGYIGDCPSVVGFSANCGPRPGMFVGDYHYQESIKELVIPSVLTRRMKWLLGLFHKNRGTLPENIIVLRDGVSEGFYDKVLEEELSYLRKACDAFLDGYNPKFVVIVATKRHSKRFFAGSEKAVENPKPLTVVDDVLVSRQITEMYIQSQKPIKGTAKPTAYQLLWSDIKEITEDTIQAFVLALCFQHQICPASISIPEPVKQADEWAKRGMNNFATYREVYTKNNPKFDVPRLSSAGQTPVRFPGDKNKEKANVNWEKVTKMLSNMGKKLEGIRLNA